MKRSAHRPTRYIPLILLLIAAIHTSCYAPNTPPPVTPDVAAAHRDAAAAHIAAGEYTAAEAAYRAIVQFTPHDPQPLLELTRLYRLWKRPQAGLSTLDEALRSGASAYENIGLRLELLAMAGDWARVAAEATAHLRAFPADHAALAWLTRAYLHDYQCLAATTLAQRWYEAAPADRDAALTWGLLAPDLPLLCEMDARLRATTLCTQNDNGAHPAMEMAAVPIRNENWPLAACVLTRAAARNPADAETRAWLGAALARMGRPAEAEEHLRAATTLAPEAPLGWLLRGTHYLGQQETDAARESLLRARALDPQNPAPYLALAEATAQVARYDEAELWLAAALDRATDDADVAKAVARFYLDRHLSHAEYPLRAIESAIRLAPDDGEAHLLLGQFRLTTGDHAGAIAALEKAVELSPSLGTAHYLRGLALQATGRNNDAQQAFTRAADLGYRP